MRTREIILVGGGGHCHACIDVIEKCDRFKIIGIIDSKFKIGDSVFGYEIIGADEDLRALVKKCRNFVICVGQILSANIRKRLARDVLNAGGNLPAIISPLAHCSRHATVADGTIVMHFAMINAGAGIGRCCIINSRALVEHDCMIGDYCHISTGANVNGHVRVGNECFVGSGAVVKECCGIADKSVIGAGSIVVNGITKRGTYSGNPARLMK